MLLSRGLPVLTAVLAWGALMPAAQAQGIPCMNEIAPLRQAVEKAGQAIKAAADKKAERSEICNRIKTFVAHEAKFIKYIETNASWCGIPPDAVAQLKKGHAHSTKMRTQACAAGPVGGRPGPPPGPGLSEALGTSRMPTNNQKSDRGTYNTLTGNPISR
jgi:hypothetical protein